MSADLVLRGGRVWPGRGCEEATAIAVRGDRVLALGDEAAIAACTGSSTRVIELDGRLVIPGFNDAHVHLMDGGFGLLSVDLRGARDESDFVRRLAEHVQTLPKGTWILKGSWDHHAWPSKTLPTRRSIDGITPDHPVFVVHSRGDMGLANSLALRLAGIERATPDPPGGTIARGADREPTGILTDSAMDLVAKLVPNSPREVNRRAAVAALAEAARLGVTTIQENSARDVMPTYLELRQHGELTARISVWRSIAHFDALCLTGVRTGLGDDWVCFGPLKLLADGSMGATTAAFFEPYSDHPEISGLLLHSPAELARLVVEADAAGFQSAVHAVGDRANALALDAFEEAVRRNGVRDRRFRIEHAQVVRRADLARFRNLGVIASIQPSHLLDDMQWAEKRIGRERCQNAYRFRSLIEAGITVTVGSDWFVESFDPRVALYAAITRERCEGGPTGGFCPEERVSLEQCLDAYTRGAAFAEFAENRKGTLLPGMLADLVVFERDLFRLPPRQILTTAVDLTMVGGRVVHQRP